MILSLIWRNLWRNKRRSVITMSSVAFAILLAVVMKSVQKGVFDNMVKNIVSFYSGYIQVHQKGYLDEQVLDNSFDYTDSLCNYIKNTNQVKTVVARIETFALASSDSVTRACMVVGTQTAEEDQLTGLKSKLVSGTYISPDDKAIVLSEGLALKLSLSVYDTIVLLGQGYHGNSAAARFPVKGISHFGSPALNESLVFLPLAAAQEFLSAENRVTTLALNINKTSELDAIGEKLGKKLGENYEVLTWKQMMPDIESFISSKNISFYIFIGVLYLLIAFGIFGTVLMMLAERKYELGMLLAIGMKKYQLALMLVGETILLSFLGTCIGMLMSFPIVKYFELHPVRMGGNMEATYKNFGFEPLWPAAVDLNIFITQATIVFCFSLVIGIYPVIKIHRTDAIKSMKR